MIWLLLVKTAYALDTDGDGLDDADEVLAHLPPTVADSDGDGLFDHLDPDMDGDGVLNVEECRLGGVTGLALINGGFEEPDSSGFGVMYPATIPGWQTTDTSFEVWEYGFEGKSAYEGDQFVEMNAYAVGTLYQDVATAIDDVYIYAFSHRGRFGADTIRFNLGDPALPLTTIRTVTDGPGAWGRWGGVITTTSTTSRFAFESVASACGLSCGNLLDAISFTPACDLDTDLDTIVDALDTDSDNDGVLDGADVCPALDDATSDPDSDGICGGFDACPYDPLNDWDADGVCGDADLCSGFNDYDDLDSDLMPDGCDSDRDGDGADESTDCNENDASVGAPLTYYPDMDGDGFGDSTFPFTTCAPGVMFVVNGGDCNELDVGVNPGVEETCLDVFDLNCDGLVPFADIDNDTICDAVDACPTDPNNDWDDDGLCVGADACPMDPFNDADGDGVCGEYDLCEGFDDALDMDEDNIPDACDTDADGDAEVEDCDDFDAFVGDPLPYYTDEDGDGYGADLYFSCSVGTTEPGDCDDHDPAAHPSASETCSDEIDLNCDGVSSFSDLDRDGVCNGDDSDQDGDGLGGIIDCDDTDALIGGPIAFYADIDGDGFGGEVVRGCTRPEGTIATAGDCADDDATRRPSAQESCLDRIDMDCDGRISFNDADGDGVCGEPCIGDDRLDADGDTIPDACDADSDNDGTPDDLDCDDLNAFIGPPVAYFLDRDGDGFGTTEEVVVGCTPPEGFASYADDCDDYDRDVSPLDLEVCDRIDNDCDGIVDPDCADTSSPADSAPTDPPTAPDQPTYEGGWGCSTGAAIDLMAVCVAAWLVIRRRFPFVFLFVPLCAAAPAETYRPTTGTWMLADSPVSGIKIGQGWTYGTFNRVEGSVLANSFTHSDYAASVAWKFAYASFDGERPAVGVHGGPFFVRGGVGFFDAYLRFRGFYLSLGKDGSFRAKVGVRAGRLAVESLAYEDGRNDQMVSLLLGSGDLTFQPAVSTGFGNAIGTPRIRAILVANYLPSPKAKAPAPRPAAADPQPLTSIVEPVPSPPPTPPEPPPVVPPPPPVMLPASLNGSLDAVAGFLAANPKILLMRLEVHASEPRMVESVVNRLVELGVTASRIESAFVLEPGAPYIDAEIVKVE